jgi:hypothetical protein
MITVMIRSGIVSHLSTVLGFRTAGILPALRTAGILPALLPSPVA